MTNTAPVLTVFFDGSCPLCRKEIGFYRRKRGADRIDWVDVSAVARGDVATGLSCDQAMRRFHVMTPAGRLIDGGHAFAVLWAALPGFRWVGKVMGLPGLRHVLNLAYDAFLPVRPALQRFFRDRGTV